MARKKRKKSDGMRLPDFDEKDFMRKEIKHASMMVATVGLSLFMAFIAAALTWTLRRADIAFGLGMLGIFLLKFTFDLFRIDTTELEKSKWAGTILTYFLTFIAVWVLLINPPLIDLVAPEIVDDTQKVQEIGSDVGIMVIVSDNQGIASVHVLVTDPNGKDGGPFKMEKMGRNSYWHSIKNPILGQYNYTVDARDDGDYLTIMSNSFTVGPYEPPEVSLWNLNPGATLFRGDAVSFLITDNTGVVFAWYSLDPDYDPTDPKATEKRLRLEDKKDAKVTIKVPKSWSDPTITFSVCAMDKVPQGTVCNSWTFPVQI